MTKQSNLDTRSRPRASIVKRVVITGVLAVAAALVLEGLVSVGMLASDIAAIRRPAAENFRQAAYDSLVGWVGQPNLAIRDNFGPGLSLTTNAEGIRIHRPLSPVPGPGEIRVMCSGASFTFGSGVSDSDTFCARLERELPGVRTINVAQRGYGIDQSYLLYKRDGGRYPHKLQIFAVNGSDFERTATATLTGYPKPTLAVRKGVLVAENVPVPPWSGWTRWDQAQTMFGDLRIAQLVSSRVNLSEAAQYRRVDTKLWPVVEAMLPEVVRLNKANGSVPVLVYLPTVGEYVPGARDERRLRLAKSTTSAGIPFIDLTPDLRTVSRDSVEWMYITANALPVRGASGHYTPMGHRWVASRLAAHLRELPATAALLAPASR